VLRRARGPLFPVRYRRGPFVGLGAVMLSAALAGSRTISFCLTASHALPRARHPVFSRLTPGYLGGKTEVCLRPLVCCRPDQSLPAATTPAPGPHTSCSKFDLSTFGRRQPYPDCSGAFSVTGRPALGTGTGPGLATGPFQPRGILDVRMSLSTFSFLLSTSRDSDSEVWSQPLRHSG